MPEFILDHGSPETAKTFRALDSFTQGYIEAMFFTSTGTGDGAENDLEHATVAELASDTLQRIVADCGAFQVANAALLELAYDRSDYSDVQAGRDYWFTTQGHGVGYWDRNQLDAGGLGDKLSAACGRSDASLCRGDDGLIYLE